MKSKFTLPLPWVQAAGVYLLCAAVGMLLSAAVRQSVPLSLAVGILLTAVLLLVFRRRAPLTEEKYFSKYLPLVLLFPALYLVMHTGELPAAEFGTALLRVLCIALEAVWVELLFRQGTLLLFSRQEMFHLRTVIFTCAVFGASCLLLNYRFAPTGAGLALDVMLSVCMGVFLTALLLRTKNVLVPMTAHFLMRLTTLLLCGPDGGGSGIPEDDILSALFLCALPLVIGGILIARGRKRELNCTEPDSGKASAA